MSDDDLPEAICGAGSCEFCGCQFRRPSDVMRHRCAAMQEAADEMSDDIELPDGPLRFVSAAVADDLRAENDRLRELYENVTGNRERFGFTINHLLECEEALRVAEAERDALAARVEELEARIARADVLLGRAYGVRWVDEARRILRGEDE